MLTPRSKRDRRFSPSCKLFCMTKAVVPLILFCFAFVYSACSTYDSRDECCEGVTIYFRYAKQIKDYFPKHIESMRHLLFDENGEFINEVPSNRGNPQQLSLSQLPAGLYTLLTVANMEKGNTFMTELQRSASWEEARLYNIREHDQTSYKNSDNLYWSQRTFEVKQNRRESYISDLSNVHCQLNVKVK